MKQVIFKKIQIKNFLSVGEDPLEIEFNQGLNIITGINHDKEGSKNGVGKSSIADALFFVLFGSTIKDLKKEEIVNNINKKHCKVIVSFDVIEEGNKNEYVIMRSILPTKIQLIKNGDDITKSSIPKTTLQIHRIIGSTPEVFENSVIMSVNNTVPFMAQKKVDKRKFIEGILTLGVFSDMLLLARQEYNDIKKSTDLEQTKFDEINNTLNIYVDQRNKKIEQRDARVNELNKREENNIGEIDILYPKIKPASKKQIEESNKNIDLLTKKENQCRKDIRKIIKNITIKEQKIEQIDERILEIKELGDICFTCKRPFNKNEKSPLLNEKKKLNAKEEQHEKKIKTFKKELKEIEVLKDRCKQAIKKQHDRIHNINIKLNNNVNTRTRIKQLKEWNKQIKIDVDELLDLKDDFDELINETQIRVDTLSNTLKKDKTELSNLDVVKFIVSEEGVKSFIVKKILKLLNGKLAFYLNKMDAAGLCMFNEYFEETIINDKGQECSYHNFSSGEQKRIDIAMLFTFMDIRRLQGDISLNISFYDEILDTSLDDKGINLFLDILKERLEKYDDGAYIISHKKEAIKSATNEIIYLEKKNGFTRRIEYGPEI